MYGFSGKHVVVTGGAMGIGRAIVEGFAVAGAKVVFADLNEAAGVRAQEEIRLRANHADVYFVHADLSAANGVLHFTDRAMDMLGAVDVLVNNVGVNFRSGDILEHREEDYTHSFETNIMSCIRCIRNLVPGMLERGSGSIVNISSTMGLGTAGFSAYAWSKGSLDTLTRSFALDYANRGIRINAVAPGLIATPSTQPWIDEQQDAAAAKGVPMGTVGQGHDIANAVLFLASDKAAYITGQVLYVDGGLSVGE
ncbi:SDR family NAD(P)-dependent oxidoreductase [Xylanibacillus composti]|uniref:SDR family NAD(P)-dependent oxidoreductase n=1 Tax=Xylanibacillus composti TaxID=1572762 RepID=UPI001BD1B5E1|nr:SDR family NAD(P)-dependent oxidoreductase [Xylanibacillus composti]